jgi:hypothetical protein
MIAAVAIFVIGYLIGEYMAHKDVMNVISKLCEVKS